MARVLLILRKIDTAFYFILAMEIIFVIYQLVFNQPGTVLPPEHPSGGWSSSRRAQSPESSTRLAIT